jgi:hypothetical protein
MKTPSTLLVIAAFALIETCVAQTKDMKRIAVVDYSKAKQVMSHEIDPDKPTFDKSLLAFIASSAGLTGGFVSDYINAYVIYANRDAILQSIKRVSASVYKYLRDQGKISKDDVQNVTQIIEAGRTNNVDQMEIGLSKEQFFGLKSSLPTPQGTAVSFDVGSSGKTTYGIKVQYNNASTKPNKSSGPPPAP